MMRTTYSRTLEIVIFMPVAVMAVFMCSALSSAPAQALESSSQLSYCPVLHFGSKGPCVTALQRQLNEDNIRPLLEIDGVYGKSTINAVERFQHIAGLPADGIVGQETANALIVHAPKPPTKVSGGKPMSSSIIVAIAATIAVVVAFLIFAWVRPRLSSHRGPAYFETKIAGNSIRTATTPSYIHEEFRVTATPQSVDVEYIYDGPADVNLNGRPALNAVAHAVASGSFNNSGSIALNGTSVRAPAIEPLSATDWPEGWYRQE